MGPPRAARDAPLRVGMCAGRACATRVWLSRTAHLLPVDAEQLDERPRRRLELTSTRMRLRAAVEPLGVGWVATQHVVARLLRQLPVRLLHGRCSDVKVEAFAQRGTLGVDKAFGRLAPPRAQRRPSLAQ